MFQSVARPSFTFNLVLKVLNHEGAAVLVDSLGLCWSHALHQHAHREDRQEAVRHSAPIRRQLTSDLTAWHTSLSTPSLACYT